MKISSKEMARKRFDKGSFFDSRSILLVESIPVGEFWKNEETPIIWVIQVSWYHGGYVLLALKKPHWLT